MNTVNVKSLNSKLKIVVGFFLLLVIVVTVIALRSMMLSETNSVTDNLSNNQFHNAGPFQIAVSLTPSTPRVGENTLSIVVRDKNNQAISDAKVRAVAQMPAMGAMPAMNSQAIITESEPGIYVGELELSMAGEWPLAIDVETVDGNHVDLTFDLATGRNSLDLASATPVSDVAYHTCSMHPSVKSATPGTCPICSMDLVPVLQQEIQSGVITVDEKRRQLIGVTTDTVIQENFSLPVPLQGELHIDPSKVTNISLRFSGWIGELHADYEGKTIKRGDSLFTVYSPELLALQEEYLETWRRRNNDEDPRLRAARQRLRLWGLTAEQVQGLEQRGQAQDYLPIYAQQDGVIMSKHIANGTAFKVGDNLLRLADLSTLWLEAYAYEQELSLLAPGMAADIRFVNTQVENHRAAIWQINPYLNNNSRTALVRFVIDNQQGELKPGLFARATVQTDLGEQLTVPTDAIVVSGDKRIVFVDLGQGRLQAQSVRTGYSDGNRTVIREGLNIGDRIVSSGNFLIAAESKLKAGIEQW